MDKDRLLDAHRAVNRLLGKLALGMERDSLNHEVIKLSERLFGKRQASILRLHPDTNTLHLEFAPHLPDFYNQAIEAGLDIQDIKIEPTQKMILELESRLKGELVSPEEFFTLRRDAERLSD